MASISHLGEWSLATRVIKAAIALGLLVCGLHAQAGSITFPGGAMPPLSFPAVMPVSRDAAVGTILNMQAESVGLGSSGITCNIQKDVTVNGTLAPGSTNVYLTGVPGVGVHFYITSDWSGPWASVPVSQTLGIQNGGWAHYVRADMVVSGPVSSGVSSTLPSMTVSFSGPCITTVTATLMLSGTTSVTSNTCSVTTPTLDYALPKVFSKDLVNTNATSGDTLLQLGLNCAAGVKVAITLTDSTTPANRSTTLSLAPQSSASGVGMQILNGTTPIGFGPDSAVAGNTNQWSAGTATGGVMQVPLTARYVRTPGTLIPGSVKGKATFTMSYQ